MSPVLFLTARDALTDRLAGFHAGGDDYLTKPFALSELIVRVHALLRRGAPRDPGPVVMGLRLDPAAHAVRCGEQIASLTPTEFRILAALSSSPGDVMRRAALTAAAWQTARSSMRTHSIRTSLGCVASSMWSA